MTKSSGRILAIDYGTRRVGLAVSDPMRIIAQGAGVLNNDGELIERLGHLAQEQEVALIIVGMPYAPDGGTGAKGGEVQEFIGRLRKAVTVAIVTWDESFSTVRAHEAIRGGGMRKKKRQEKGRVDEMAARLLLEEFLESSDHR